VDCVTGDVAGRNTTTEGDTTKQLAALQDPELIARWAALRTRMPFRSDPDYPDLKAEYDALVVEYRRRITGHPPEVDEVLPTRTPQASGHKPPVAS